MTTHKKIIIASSVAIVSYAGFFAYRAYQRKKIDDSIVSYEQAIQMLQQAKTQSKPWYLLF